jgi:hypothetical protein
VSAFDSIREELIADLRGPILTALRVSGYFELLPILDRVVAVLELQISATEFAPVSSRPLRLGWEQLCWPPGSDSGPELVRSDLGPAADVYVERLLSHQLEFGPLPDGSCLQALSGHDPNAPLGLLSGPARPAPDTPGNPALSHDPGPYQALGDIR